MYTNIKAFKESLLVPRNIDTRHDKLKQVSYKLLQQEIINGDLTIDDSFVGIDDNMVKLKLINGNVTLDLDYQPEWLKRININGNLICVEDKEIKLLDCSNYIDLKSLNCDYNFITSLDLSNCTKLESLDCCNNDLRILNISKNLS